MITGHAAFNASTRTAKVDFQVAEAPSSKAAPGRKRISHILHFINSRGQVDIYLSESILGQLREALHRGWC